MTANNVGDPSWPEVLELLVDARLAAVHTSLPAQIISYDATSQKATVRFGLTHEGVKIPDLVDAPVVWPNGLHGELVAGNGVLVVFTEESFGEWDEKGGVQDPGLQRRHGLHGVVFPGFNRTSEPVPGASAVTHLVGTEVRLGSAAASEFVALASLVRAELDALKAAVAVAATAEAGSGGLGGMAHLQTALAAWPLTDTAATKVKAT